MINVNIAMSER